MGDNFNIYEGKPQVSIPDQIRTLVTESKKVFSEIDFEPGQNALEEMLELGNEPGVSSAVHVPSECPAKVAIKIEALVCPDGADEKLENDAFLNSSEMKILPTETTETEEAFETETVEQDNVEQSIGSNCSEGSDWSCSSSSSQQAEREDHGEHIELQAQASTSETGHGGADTRRRKMSPQQDDGNRKKKHRATKTFTPAELKDEEYWERRKKNNEAARRSRKLKKLNVSRTRLNELIQQNEQLMEQVLSSRTAIEAFKNNILSVGLDLKNL